MKNPQKFSATLFAVAIAVFIAGCANDANRGSSRSSSGQQARHTPVITPLPASEEVDQLVTTDDTESQDLSSQEVKQLLEAYPETTMSDAIGKVSRKKEALYPSADVAAVSSAQSVESELYLPPLNPINQYGNNIDRDQYINFEENAIKLVNREPVSTFSIDVDTASYSNVRRMLAGEGRLPPMDAVKVEEMINYFNYDYPVPSNKEVPFSVTTEVARSPWNPNRHLLKLV